MEVPADVRPSPIAGSWYPGDPGRLARSVDGYLAAAQLPEAAGTVVAVVAPHAGHRYSGPVAGYAFAALRGLGPGVVAVVGPLHDLHPRPLLTSGHAAYETPLGTIPVDRDAVERLDAQLHAAAGAGLARIRNDREHSLEIELPFLQRALAGPFRLLPVMVRERRPDALRTLGWALARALEGRPALLVASTDLSHFHSQAVAKTLDGEMLRRVEALDPEAVLGAEAAGRGEACGAGALAAVLWAARDLGADCARVLRHATSGDVTGDLDEVVGYGAAILYAAPGGGHPAARDDADRQRR